MKSCWQLAQYSNVMHGGMVGSVVLVVSSRPLDDLVLQLVVVVVVVAILFATV
jgi:hypothetical protein